MIFINLIFLSIFYFCFVYWKYLIWGGNLLNYFINPLPLHLDGAKLFHNYLINYNRNDSLFNMFMPKSVGEYTEAIGIGVLIFIYFFTKKNKLFLKFIPVFLFFIIINHFFGQSSSRFYFELYVWTMLILSSTKNLDIEKKFKLFFYVQFIVSIFAIWTGVFTMSYGSLSKNLRHHVMTNTANGYSLFKWSNEVFKDKDAKVLSMHRSTSLAKGNVYATTFQGFLIFPKDKIQPYHIKNIIDDYKGPFFLLTFGNKDNIGIFKNCIDYLYTSKKNVGRHVGRNPFNKSGYYDGFIFKLKDLQKTNCLNS